MILSKLTLLAPTMFLRLQETLPVMQLSDGRHGYGHVFTQRWEKQKRIIITLISILIFPQVLQDMVMVQVTAGRLNKQIAHDIGISESTVKVHRTHLMRKMKARSLPELSRMADMLKLAPEKPQRS